MSKLCFGIAYESERQYILYLPQSSSDSSATLAYVYNYFTKTWVTCARTQASGYVLSSDNKLYMGNALTNFVVRERKDYAYTDYTDESVAVAIASFSGQQVTLTNASGVSIGDILYQSSAVSSTVTAVTAGLNTISVNNVLTWAIGGTQLLKSIPCTIQWAPTSGGNPGMLKQYSEAALVFRASPFLSALISCLSDISGSYDSVAIAGYSAQGWGFFSWGSAPWGGVSRPQTIRTFIPRDKQRCTLLTTQFFCQSGWSNFQLEGLSLQYRLLSSRTTR